MSTLLRVVIPLYCIIPLAQLINTLLILVVTEKENKIKDGLKMIGVSDFAYWLVFIFHPSDELSMLATYSIKVSNIVTFIIAGALGLLYMEEWQSFSQECLQLFSIL